MGIDWTEEEFGNDCGCYPPGRTPKYLYASVSGIEWCTEGVPVAGPPNGIFKMTQDPGFPCIWTMDAGGVTAWYSLAGGWSQLDIGISAPMTLAFTHLIKLPCLAHFSNQLICPGILVPPWYHGGTGIVLSRGNDPLPSLQDFAELFGLIEDPFAKCDFWPVDTRILMLRYARQKSPTNILMKIDWTEYDQYDMFEW